jgi:Spy/CpxP family protein refolding chaperone
MTKISLFAIGAILLAGLSSPAFAQAPAGGGAGHRGMHGGLPPIPDLTADQKQKIADLKTTAMQQSAPLHDQIAALRKDMQALWAADPLDRQAIASKQAAVDALHTQMKAIWSDFFFQLHDVLTPAQRAWLAQHGPGKGGHLGGPGFGMGPEQP